MLMNKMRMFTKYINSNKVKEISNDEYIEFVKENDIFDYKKADYVFGLYSNYLVAVCGFTHLGSNIYKVCNMCSKKRIFVENWFDIIVDYFVSKYKPYSLICNVDLRYFDSFMYSR